MEYRLSRDEERDLKQQIIELVEQKPVTRTTVYKQFRNEYNITKPIAARLLKEFVAQDKIRKEKPTRRSAIIYYRTDYQKGESSE